MSDDKCNRTIPLFDGHNDALLRIWDKQIDPEAFVTGATGDRPGTVHLDLPRARQGGLLGGFFAMFVPTPKASRKAGTKQHAVGQVEPPPSPASGDPASGDPDNEGPADLAPPRGGKDGSYRIPRARPIGPEVAGPATEAMLSLAARLVELKALEVITEASRLSARLQDPGLGPEPDPETEPRPLAAILHLEGAEAIEKDLSNLESHYRRGVRSIGPVWSRSNVFGHGVPFAYPASPDIGEGLTRHGRALVETCNELGILIDLAHLNLAGFRDVARLSSKPLVATHTCAHALAPTARNLLDEQIDEIGRSGGLIGVNLHVADLRADGKWDSQTPIELWVDHVEYIVERIGIDHVALGSDFDGALMPKELGDASGLQRLIAALRRRGLAEGEIEQLATGNWQRTLAETWA